MRRFLIVFAAVANLVLVDAVSKEIAAALLKGRAAVSVIPGLFSLAYVENRGCAWGMLQGQVWPLAVFGIAALALLVWRRRDVFAAPEGSPRMASVLGAVAEPLVYAGIIGNVIDRVLPLGHEPLSVLQLRRHLHLRRRGDDRSRLAADAAAAQGGKGGRAMIAYIRGILAEKEPTRAVVEAGGVGYELFIPLSTYDRLPRQGEEAKLLAAHVVRDDAEALFGFATAEEREMFTMLVSVSGVGPKIALSMLSGSSLGDLAQAIAGGDVKRISSIKGVGRKTAGKICVELKDKVGQFGAAPMANDAVMALRALGFAEDASAKMVADVLAANPSVDSVGQVVKLALAGR